MSYPYYIIRIIFSSGIIPFSIIGYLGCHDQFIPVHVGCTQSDNPFCQEMIDNCSPISDIRLGLAMLFVAIGFIKWIWNMIYYVKFWYLPWKIYISPGKTEKNGYVDAEKNSEINREEVEITAVGFYNTQMIVGGLLVAIAFIILCSLIADDYPLIKSTLMMDLLFSGMIIILFDNIPDWKDRYNNFSKLDGYVIPSMPEKFSSRLWQVFIFPNIMIGQLIFALVLCTDKNEKCQIDDWRILFSLIVNGICFLHWIIKSMKYHYCQPKEEKSLTCIGFNLVVLFLILVVAIICYFTDTSFLRLLYTIFLLPLSMVFIANMNDNSFRLCARQDDLCFTPLHLRKQENSEVNLILLREYWERLQERNCCTKYEYYPSPSNILLNHDLKKSEKEIQDNIRIEISSIADREYPILPSLGCVVAQQEVPKENLSTDSAISIAPLLDPSAPLRD